MNKQSSQSSGPNLTDILLFLLSKWPWFLLSLAVCVAFAWYRASTEPLVYYANTKVIIKVPSNQSSSAGLDRYQNSINRVNVTNEILQLRSKRIIQEVVARMHADITYLTHNRLRDVNIYGETPLEVVMPSVSPKASFSFSIVPIDSLTTRLILPGNDGKSRECVMQNKKMYKVMGESMMLHPTGKMSPGWYGREIKVIKESELAVVNRIVANLGIRQEEEDGSIIDIAVQSGSATFGIDLLNTIIKVYNEESINEKNQVAVNTARFIDERLSIIGRELGGVESELESYRRENKVVDIGSMTSRYMGESARYNAEALQYDTQLRIAEFIKEYLTDPARSNDLIPTGLGINDQAVERSNYS